VCICICWVCCSIPVSGINAMVGDWTVLYRPLLAVKSQKLFLVSMNHGVVKMVPVHCNLHKECVFVLFCAIVLNVKASVFPCIAGLLVLLSGIFLAHTKWPGFLGVRSRWGWCQPLNHLVENVRRSCRCYVVRRVDWVCWISEHCQGCWTCSHQQRVLLHFSESSLGVGVLPQVGIPDICRCIQGEGCVCDEMCMSIGLCIIYIYI